MKSKRFGTHVCYHVFMHEMKLCSPVCMSAVLSVNRVLILRGRSIKHDDGAFA